MYFIHLTHKDILKRKIEINAFIMVCLCGNLTSDEGRFPGKSRRKDQGREVTQKEQQELGRGGVIGDLPK